MSKIKDVLAGIALNAIEGTAQTLLLDLLENIKENNQNDPELIKDTVKQFHSALKLLDRAADKTKTNIDNKLVDILLEPVVQFAEAEGIQL